MRPGFTAPVSLPKSFPVQTDEHLRRICRYVERNARSAGLVKRAEEWRWGSLWARRQGTEQVRRMLSRWPGGGPGDCDAWARWVNEPLTAKELERIDVSVKRGRPLGSEAWVARAADKLHLEHTLRREGRPSKATGQGSKN